MTRDVLAEKLEGLRRAFDESFARPAAGPDEATEHLLAVRVGGEPYAVRLEQIQGLHSGKRIVAVPSREPAFLGLAGLRGTVVPVYSLALLLGHAPGRAPAWIVLPAGADRVALAFEAYEGHRTHARLPAARERGEAGTPVVRLEGEPRPILDVADVVAAIRRRVTPDASPEERKP